MAKPVSRIANRLDEVAPRESTRESSISTIPSETQVAKSASGEIHRRKAARQIVWSPWMSFTRIEKDDQAPLSSLAWHSAYSANLARFWNQ